MTKKPAPQLQIVAKDKYRCVDLPVLHRWLEAHGYSYYGQHAPGVSTRATYANAGAATTRH